MVTEGLAELGGAGHSTAKLRDTQTLREMTSLIRALNWVQNFPKYVDFLKFYSNKNDPKQIGWMLINGDCRAGGTGSCRVQYSKALRHADSWREDLEDTRF